MATKSTRPRHYLREWRKARGLTQAQLAEKLGVQKTVLSRYETGERGVSIKVLFEILAALDIMPGQFYAPPEEPSIDAVVAKLTPERKRELLQIARLFSQNESGDK